MMVMIIYKDKDVDGRKQFRWTSRKENSFQVGEKSTNKSDTVARRLILSDLQPGTTYELVSF